MDETEQKRGDAAERLDFSPFLARFFPGRRRHNFEAITAYAAYRNELEPPDPAAT